MNLAELSKSFSNWFTVKPTIDDTVNRSMTGVSVDLLALEERVLYSAAPLPADFLENVDFDRFDDVNILDHVDQHLDILLQAVEELVPGDEPIELFEPRSLHIVSGDIDLSEQSRLELVVVDQSVENYLVFVENLVSQNSDERHFEVIQIKSEADGVRQISDYLDKNNQVFAALHLVTHGADGQILLGNSTLSSSALSNLPG